MKIKFGYIPLLILIPIFIACDKDDECSGGDDGNVNTYLNKEVRIDFPFEYWVTNDTNYESFPVYSYLKDFDKNDYLHIDSIFIICTIATETEDSAFVRLYNISDDMIIPKSDMVQSTETAPNLVYRWTSSKNILDYLPNKKTDLCLQMKSKRGQYVYLRSAYLLIKRK